MARIYNGILGIVRGSLDDITGCYVYGTNYLKQKEHSKNYTPSPGQLIVQFTFKQTQLFCNTYFDTFLEHSIFPDSNILSPQTWFVKDNYNAFNADGLFLPEELSLSFGTLNLSLIGSGWMRKSWGLWNLLWYYESSEPNQSPNDPCRVAISNNTLNKFYFPDISANRNMSHLSSNMPVTWQAGNSITFFLYFLKHPDLSDASITAHLTTVILA